MSDFSNNLKNLREERQLSISALASGIKVSPSTIKSWETGKTQPKLKHLVKLSLFFKVKFKELIGV